MSLLYIEDYQTSFVVETLFSMHFLDTEYMVNISD